MEQLLSRLVSEARTSQNVVSSKLKDDLSLLAYPHEQTVLVALGYQTRLRQPGQSASLLRLRGSNLQRFGAWLPAMFNDGSWYVVRRVPVLMDDGPVLTEEELAIGLELLA